LLPQLLEELAHEVLHDASLKKLLFQSGALVLQACRWTDTFRQDIHQASAEPQKGAHCPFVVSHSRPY
jgi:hypothetical protein